jgi:hypothetical protein
VTTSTPPPFTHPTRPVANVIVGVASCEKSVVGAGNGAPLSLQISPPSLVDASRAPQRVLREKTPRPSVALVKLIVDNAEAGTTIPMQLDPETGTVVAEGLRPRRLNRLK